MSEPKVPSWPVEAEEGDMVIWTENGMPRVDVLLLDPTYEDGQRVGGRSLKNVWEAAERFRVVKA